MKIDAAELLLRMRNGQKRLAYATVRAANRTAQKIQQAEFENVDEEFEIRNRRFFFGDASRPGGVAARISFASVPRGQHYAEVFVGRASTISSQRRVVLPIFEAGGEKAPGKQVAIPITGRAARPSFASPVVKAFTFAGMALQAHRGGRRVLREVRGRKGRTTRRGVGLFGEFGRVSLPVSDEVTQWKGRSRTFLLTSSRSAPDGGVFRRTGKGRDDIELIWSFRRHVRLDARLGWIRTARATADAWFREEMAREVVGALAHDRGRSL